MGFADFHFRWMCNLPPVSFTPEECARTIVDAVKRDAPRVLVGLDAKIMDKVQRLIPTGYQRIAARLGRKNWRKHD